MTTNAAIAACASFKGFDPTRVPSPCFVVDEVALEQNLQVLSRVARESGARLLAALKAFSMWSLAPQIARHVQGTCASGYHEARLGAEEYGGEVHVFSAAYSEPDLRRILPLAHHVVFNSCGQWQRFRSLVRDFPQVQAGLRINPEHSEGTTPLYDPCAPCSRLGIPRAELDLSLLDGIDGLHFHTLCEQGFPPLQRTLAAVEERFGDLLPRMKWVNIGGGHLITAPDYDVQCLIDCLRAFAARHQVQVYLEPGEAFAINTGVLVCEVLDLTRNNGDIAILDTSATCHMPDTLEMPYRPALLGETDDPHAPAYRLGGMTCLAGDVIGTYRFPAPLRIGQRLVWLDMAHYTMVKTSTFNGINLPSIAIWNSQTDALRVVRSFGYEDFKHRLS